MAVPALLGCVLEIVGKSHESVESSKQVIFPEIGCYVMLAARIMVFNVIISLVFLSRLVAVTIGFLGLSS